MRETMDEYSYPKKSELEKLHSWDYKQGFEGLVELIRDIWWAPDWGFKLHKGRDSLLHKPVMKLELHTGGWSGNESIIEALTKSDFWILCKIKCCRGGHYWFEIPMRLWKARIKKEG